MALDGQYEGGAADTWGPPPVVPGVDFFRDVLAPMNPCCRLAVENATENLAVLAPAWISRAVEALEAAVGAVQRGDSPGAQALISIANEYRALAKDVT